MPFQQKVRQNWSACILEWQPSYLQLPHLLQTMVFHFQRCRVLSSRGYWWCDLYDTWKWCQKELAPPSPYRRSVWERRQGNSARGILGWRLCWLRICWRLHRLELSVPDLRGRNTTPTGLNSADKIPSPVLRKLSNEAMKLWSYAKQNKHL